MPSLTSSARALLRLAFRDSPEAGRLAPDLAPASHLLIQNELNTRCSPWPSAPTIADAIEACSIILEEVPSSYTPVGVGRARIQRGLLLKQAGRTAEAAADFRLVAALASGATPDDMQRAEEELRGSK